MATYAVLTTVSTVEVPTPGLAVDALSTTIQVSGSNIVATLVLPQAWYDNGTAQTRLGVFADAIDSIWLSGKVSGAIGGQAVDENGLLQTIIDWTVSYTPPSGIPLTNTVEIATSDIGGTGLGTGNVGPAYAQGIIDAAYAQLEAIASGGTSSG